ncbi:MAG: hypothetical protein ACREMD_15480 [Gemmatimonadota bacterium]
MPALEELMPHVPAAWKEGFPVWEGPVEESDEDSQLDRELVRLAGDRNLADPWILEAFARTLAWWLQLGQPVGGLHPGFAAFVPPLVVPGPIPEIESRAAARRRIQKWVELHLDVAYGRTLKKRRPPRVNGAGVRALLKSDRELPHNAANLKIASLVNDRRYAFLVLWQGRERLEQIARWYERQLRNADLPQSFLEDFGEALDAQTVNREIRRAAEEVDFSSLRRDPRGRGPR